MDISFKRDNGPVDELIRQLMDQVACTIRPLSAK